MSQNYHTGFLHFSKEERASVFPYNDNIKVHNIRNHNTVKRFNNIMNQKKCRYGSLTSRSTKIKKKGSITPRTFFDMNQNNKAITSALTTSL